jgi:hypothetical protein
MAPMVEQFRARMSGLVRVRTSPGGLDETPSP